MRSNSILFLLIVIPFFYSCKSSLNISVLRPASIDIPKDSKKIIVLNNTLLRNKSNNAIVEGILTGEQIFGDKNASLACVQALTRAINNSKLFTASYRGEIEVLNYDRSVNWETITELCKKENAELIVALDFFDTNSGIGSKVLGGVNQVAGTAHFSIYYPSQKLIISDYVVTDYKATGAASPSLNPLAVINDVIVKSELLVEVGETVGAKAGAEIVPTWIWVNRMFYTGGGKDLRFAKHLIRSGNWDMAEQKLIELTNSIKDRRVRKANYNLALVKEAQGDLEAAVKYAETAALMFNDKHAPAYVQILKQRQNDEVRLAYQLQAEGENK
jgi:hypothetical protein